MYAFEKTGQICTPWYFPYVPGVTSRPCDPWGAYDFLEAMSTIPDSQCDHCLPDCEMPIYSTSATTAKFRRCDEKNFGLSLLCSGSLEDLATPPIWGQDVKEDYVNFLGAMPDYVKLEQTNKRR